MKLISIIGPVYNEEKNIRPLIKKIKEVVNKINNYSWEIILLNDGSEDNSQQELEDIARDDVCIKIIQFSRHFGKELAMTAGINNCQGEACIILDADLQHPPELIPQFLSKWEQGAEIVIGVRKNNQGGMIKKIGSRLFYKIINIISETKMIPNTTDYRLLDRKVIDAFNNFTEKNRMMRGLIDWLGFSRDYIYFRAHERHSGKATYSLQRLFHLAFSTFVSFSLFPLKIAGYLGIVITLFAGMMGLFVFIERFLLHDPWNMYFSGTAILAILNLFLIGIVLGCLGLIALYIANIQQEVVNRPLYVVKKRINF